MDLLTRRGLETLGMMMIGDGVLGMIEPGRHVGLWRQGPPAWRKTMDLFEDRPWLTVAFGAAEAALGVCLARAVGRDADQQA